MKEPTLKDLPESILEWIETPRVISSEFLLICGVTSTKDYDRLISNEKLKIKCVPILFNNEFSGSVKLVRL